VSGRNSFNKLRDKIESDPVRRERTQEIRDAYDALLTLADLRRSQGLTQAELAHLLGVSQPNVSKIEHGDEVHLSTLGGYIAALGGRLEVRAVFKDHPEHDVTIDVTSERGA
jgi:DNA-binding XRE family transcriptional regulator